MGEKYNRTVGPLCYATSAGGSFRAPFETRNAYRQTGRRTVDLRLSREFRLHGRKRIVALAEGFNIFNWVNYTGFSNLKYGVASSSYNAATNQVTINLAENTGFAKPSAASNTLFRTTRRAAGDQVPVVASQ